MNKKKKKTYGKYEFQFKAFTFAETKNPEMWKKTVRDSLREMGCFLIEPSFKYKLIIEMDEPPKVKGVEK